MDVLDHELRMKQGRYKASIGLDYDKETQYIKWCQERCPSFVGWEIVDVADVTIQIDIILDLWFNSEEDLTLFKLTWG